MASIHLGKQRKKRGFTLIELVAAVAVVGILAMIAYPSYRAYLVRANRAEVQEFMLDVADRQEQYLLDARGYGTLEQMNLAVPARIGQYYTVTVLPDNAATPPAYSITAEPKPDTVQQADAVLALDSLGEKSPAELWQGLDE
jgi:type IV pilus assembly protein PilE